MIDPPKLTCEDRKDLAAIIEAALGRKTLHGSTGHGDVDRFVRDVEESMAAYLLGFDGLPSLRTAFPSDIDIGELRKAANKLYNATRSAAREL